MADRADYRQQWEQTYQAAYAQGNRHWRPELACPPAFKDFMTSEWAPPPGGRILEAGCGDGLNAICLSQAGYRVVGVDVVQVAIDRARQAAAEQHVDAQFLCLDLVHDTVPCAGAYDLWVDIKVLHCLWEDGDRAAYLVGAAKAVRPGGHLFLNCGLAMADVRDYFPTVFAALDPDTRVWADCADRDLPKDKRQGIRCETLDWYCHEIEHAGLEICHARREASLQAGWGAIVVARKPA